MPFACALTLDDAPVMDPARLAPGAPTPIDTVRETLQRRGVQHCVAFVVGRFAPGHEAALERWLAAGYELGNHTYDHAWASRSAPRDFIASFERCHALLETLGAFRTGRPRYFRYPYGDRAAQPDARAEIERAWRNDGYTLADVSISLHDYAYEGPLHDALAHGDLARAQRIEQRYLATVRRAITWAHAARTEPDFVHVACAHFGRVTERTLDRVLDALQDAGPLRDVASATGCATYARIARDPRHNGTADHALFDARGLALQRRLVRVARRLDLFHERALGPCWPHLD